MGILEDLKIGKYKCLVHSCVCISMLFVAMETTSLLHGYTTVAHTFSFCFNLVLTNIINTVFFPEVLQDRIEISKPPTAVTVQRSPV